MRNGSMQHQVQSLWCVVYENKSHITVENLWNTIIYFYIRLNT